MDIDLNCDLGEGAGFDAELLALVSSANVCCGFHAGSVDTVRAALAQARAHGVSVGAHPGFPDRANFGRVDWSWPPERVLAECMFQIGALVGLAKDVGTRVRYLKPHGGLYHLACREASVAGAVARAAQHWDLAVLALPRSQLEAACHARGIPFAAEGFADRRNRPDGSLVPRGEPDALILDPAEAVRQAETLVASGIRSLCVHGDQPEAVAFVEAMRQLLGAAGHTLRAFA